MPKKIFKKKNVFVNVLPFAVLVVLGILFFAALLRIGVGEAEWAGLVVSDLSGELEARYEIPHGETGVVVVIVQEQALNSGVEIGDLLKAMNGKKVTNVQSFLNIAKFIDIRKGALLDIVRKGEPLYVTLYDRPGVHGKIKRALGLEPGAMKQVALTKPALVPPAAPVTEATWLGTELEAGPQGIIIDDVPVGSLAEKAGFKTGDVISAIDGIVVKDMAGFNKVTLNGTVKQATVEVIRGTDKVYIFVQGPPPKGVGQRAAFSFTKPLLSPSKGIKPKGPLVTNAPGRAASLPPVEGHWVGMETLDLSPQLALFMNIPVNVKGVLIDEVTMESLDAGLMAGDVVTKIGDMNTYNLKQFRTATRLIRNHKSVNVIAFRKGSYKTFTVNSMWAVGVAQMETAQMITKGAIAPHRYRGPCTNCHMIGNTGQLAKDAGDLLTINAPPIKQGAKAPHRYRGKCSTCHTIIK